MVLTRSHVDKRVAGVAPAAEANKISGSDPSQKFTVKYLRGLLLDANVSIPPRTRKADLIKICTESKLIHTKSEISEADATREIGKDSCGKEANEPVPDDHSRLLENMPSQFDDVYYLMPDFVPTMITVPTLQNILCRHNIGYNGKETKADLVNLFNKYIKPKAAATLAAIEAVERSEEGIVDV